MADEPGGCGRAVDPRRRRFLNAITLGLSAVGAILIAVPVLVFIAGPLLKKAKTAWQPVGRVEAFAVGSTTLIEYEDPSPLAWAGVTARSAAWLRRESDSGFIAFSVNCTHLGCPVRWLDGAGLFMCPCHGGVYYRDGRVAAGPPPASLPRYPVRVQEGLVEILVSPLPATV